jgi:hypothetical protein
MALSSSRLASAIRSKVESKNPDFADNIDDSMDWLFEAVAEAVVEEIQANARVGFSAGQITGLDAPSGDTHSTLTASDGTVT